MHDQHQPSKQPSHEYGSHDFLNLEQELGQSGSALGAHDSNSDESWLLGGDEAPRSAPAGEPLGALPVEHTLEGPGWLMEPGDEVPRQEPASSSRPAKTLDATYCEPETPSQALGRSVSGSILPAAAVLLVTIGGLGAWKMYSDRGKASVEPAPIQFNGTREVREAVLTQPVRTPAREESGTAGARASTPVRGGVPSSNPNAARGQAVEKAEFAEPFELSDGAPSGAGKSTPPGPAATVTTQAAVVAVETVPGPAAETSVTGTSRTPAVDVAAVGAAPVAQLPGPLDSLESTLAGDVQLGSWMPPAGWVLPIALSQWARTAREHEDALAMASAPPAPLAVNAEIEQWVVFHGIPMPLTTALGDETGPVVAERADSQQFLPAPTPKPERAVEVAVAIAEPEVDPLDAWLADERWVPFTADDVVALESAPIEQVAVATPPAAPPASDPEVLAADREIEAELAALVATIPAPQPAPELASLDALAEEIADDAVQDELQWLAYESADADPSVAQEERALPGPDVEVPAEGALVAQATSVSPQPLGYTVVDQNGDWYLGSSAGAMTSPGVPSELEESYPIPPVSTEPVATVVADTEAYDTAEQLAEAQARELERNHVAVVAQEPVTLPMPLPTDEAPSEVGEIQEEVAQEAGPEQDGERRKSHLLAGGDLFGQYGRFLSTGRVAGVSGDGVTSAGFPDDEEVDLDELLPDRNGLRRVADSNRWSSVEVPTHLFDVKRRVYTPNVGDVRLVMIDGEVLEGQLHSVGNGTLWIDSTAGRMQLGAERVENVQRLGTVGRVASVDPEDRDYSALPHVRVRTLGGVFTGRELARDGERITLMTDEGYRVTLEAQSVEPANQRRTVGLRER